MQEIRPMINHRFLGLTLMLILLGLVALSGSALAAAPYLVYSYPAGGQKGTTFTVTIGGQNLKGVSIAEITGDGVKASVAGYVGSGGPLSYVQEEYLKLKITDLINKASGKKTQPIPSTAVVKLPDLIDFRDLEKKTVTELREINDKYTNRSRRPVAPMAEEVTLKVTVDGKASPGDRELRLRTSSGYSNPLVFQVSSLPEIKEPDAALDKGTNRIAASVSRTPVVLNGQIMPGDVDRFPLQLSAGQKIMAVAFARELTPYLADAVPGWFQAVIALYDADGHEVAYADDCGYDPDPILTYQVPKDGEYYLEIHDSVYRGRRDFVYRIAVGDASIQQVLLPSGTRGGVRFAANRSNQEAASAEASAFPSWSSLQAVAEKKANDSSVQAQNITLPQIVRGSISEPGDIDYYQFTGKAGDEIVAEVLARRAGSVLDSLLRLMDANGKVLAWNDDTPDKGAGLLTHQSDSYIRFRLPETGTYTLQVSDVQRHGGDEYTYSFRVSQPLPDFALWMSPSALSISSGNTAVVLVDVMRADGWDGEIELSLKDAPDGYVLGGAKIPPGRSQIRMTLTKPTSSLDFIQIEGRAVIEGKTVVHSVQPADRMMQAFANYHLVSSQNSRIPIVRTTSTSPVMSLSSTGTVLIPSTGTAQIICTIKPMPTVPVRLELREPPAGIFLKETKQLADGVLIVLAVDNKNVGYADNLIFEAFTETVTPGKVGAPAVTKKTSIGVLPAVPIVVLK